MAVADGVVLHDTCGLTLEMDLEPPVGGPWKRVEGPDPATVAGRSVHVSGPYTLVIGKEKRGGGSVVDFEITRGGEPFVLRQYRLDCRIPAVDVITPAQRYTGYAHVKSHNPDELVSTATTKEFPLVLFGSRSGENRLAVGLEDLLTETRIHRGLRAGYTYYDCVGARFTRPFGDVRIHTARFRDAIYVSQEPRSWWEVMCDYWDWVDQRRGYRPLDTPPSAYGPIWCSWHYLTDIDQDRIWANALQVKELGLKVVDIDAGWYCPDVGIPFSDSPLTSDTFGFGRVEADRVKFPDMAGLVKRIHEELGLYVWAWATPRWTFRALETGPKAVDRRLLDCRMRTGKGELTQYLCTRTPDTRLHAARFTAHILKTYGFDGLKFDCWELDEGGDVCTADHPHDTDTMGQGTWLWAREIHRAMTEAKPDVMVWFNNTSLKPFSNFSCSPNEVYCHPDENWRMSVLTKTYARGIVSQLMEGSWHRDEEDHRVARQLAVFLMGHVPEVQVNLLELRESHRRLLKAWSAWYEAHRKDLIHGRYRPFGMEHTLGGPVAVMPPNVRIDSPPAVYLWIGPIVCDGVDLESGTRTAHVLNQRSGVLPSLRLRGLRPGKWRVTASDIYHQERESRVLNVGGPEASFDLGLGEGETARIERLEG